MTNETILRCAPWVGDILNDRSTKAFWAHGGLGCGKTFGLVIKHYNWVLENLDCGVSWFVEPTYGKVDSIAIPAWRDFFNLIGLVENTHYRFLRSKPQSLEIFTGLSTHRVLFQSDDRANLMVGENIGYFTLDEAGSCKALSHERATDRLRANTVNYAQYAVGGAPQGLNWFADFANFSGHDTAKNEKSYEIWTEHNAHNLRAGYVEDQKRKYAHNPNKLKSFLYGIFTNFFEGSAYPDFDVERDGIELAPHPSTPLILSWDNNAPLAWVTAQERTIEVDLARDKLLCFVGESRGTARLISDACVDFITQHEPSDGWRDTPIILDGDSALFSPSVRQSGSSFDEILQTLRKYYRNVSVVASRYNPLQEVRVESVNKAFSYGRVKVSLACPKLIRSLQRTSWKEGNTRELAKPKDQDVNAFSDAAGYYIYKYMKAQEQTGKHKRTLLY